MRELAHLKQIFLTDVDPETRDENLRQIQEWENALTEHSGFRSWSKHDVSRVITTRAREAYVDASLVLASKRDIDEQTRMNLWAKKDAAMWLITLIEGPSDAIIQSVKSQVRRALEKANQLT